MEPASKKLKSDIPEGYFHLGDHLLCGVSLFQNRVRIHLRMYTDEWIPTKKGIVFTPYQMSCFFKQAKNEISKAGESLNVDNALLFTSFSKEEKLYMMVQYMFLGNSFRLSSTHICLSSDQYKQFVSLKEDLLVATRKCLFQSQLPALMMEKELPSTPFLGDIYESLKLMLVESTQALLNTCKIDCMGCQLHMGNQLGHECMSTVVVDLYFEEMVFKMDMKELAQKFTMKTRGYATYKDFFDQLHVENLMDEVKQTLYLNYNPLFMY